MKKYSIYQFTKYHFETNNAEHNKDVHKLYLDSMVLGKVAPRTFDLHYGLVGWIHADNLDEVFEIGNIGPEGRVIKFSKKMRSISVGDVICVDHELYVVKPCGFELLEEGVAA
tara:strand:- start:893 stop:1231 length:339 start_codon:yes stop_codon:yes gene_type:complete